MLDKPMFQKILVAVDQSEISQRVFQSACAIATASQGNLLLCHVLTPLGDSGPPVLALGIEGVYPGIHGEALQQYMRGLDDSENQGMSLLQSLQAEAAGLGLQAEILQSIGDPGANICNAAATWGADLIVLGRRGLSGFSELFLGSVSNYVLHHAQCSVLTIQSQPGAANAATNKVEATAAL